MVSPFVSLFRRLFSATATPPLRLAPAGIIFLLFQPGPYSRAGPRTGMGLRYVYGTLLVWYQIHTR